MYKRKLKEKYLSIKEYGKHGLKIVWVVPGNNVFKQKHDLTPTGHCAWVSECTCVSVWGTGDCARWYNDDSVSLLGPYNISS